MPSLTPRRRPLPSLLLATALATAVVALPVGANPDGFGLTWHTATAKKGGEGGGHGGGHDRGDHGRGEGRGGGQGHGKAHGDDGDGANGRGRGHWEGDLDDFVDDVRSGRAFGRRDDDPRVDQAKERYGAALGHKQGEVEDEETSRGRGRAAHRFSTEETEEMIGRGWRGRAVADGFENHGQRVRTMVELAKRLGHSPRVGAMQANFGTPFENGIAELQAQLEKARAEAEARPEDAGAHDRVAELNEALAEAIAAAKPGKGPDDGWATVDLDVNDDGVVDRGDLAALDEAAETTGEEAADGSDDEAAGSDTDDEQVAG